jgi:hypothetical protein
VTDDAGERADAIPEDTVTLAEVREQAARVYYRWMMGDDYESFPWDDENEPSNETKREAEQFAADLLARFGAARAENPDRPAGTTSSTPPTEET